jgi:hypothetical protein
LLIGGTFWLALRGGTLNVTLTDASGKITNYSQSIDSNGAAGSVAGAEGTSSLFKVSGLPGKDTTISYTYVSAAGKLGALTVVPFASGSAKLNMADNNGHIVNSAVFTSRIGARPGTIMLDAMLLGLALFAPYIGAIHIYSMKRLRPLIAELPHTDARMSFGDTTKSFVGKASVKLLTVMGVGAVLALAGNAINLIEGLLAHRSIDSLETTLFGMALSDRP